MGLQHPPAELRCCPGVARCINHHLGNAGTGGGGFVEILLRDATLSPAVRAELEHVRAAWVRVQEVNRALVPDPALCAHGRETCEGDACPRGPPGDGHHERLVVAAVQAYTPDGGGLDLIDRLYQILAADRLAHRKEETP